MKLVTLVIECEDDNCAAIPGAAIHGEWDDPRGKVIKGKCVGAFMGDAVGKMMEYEEVLIDHDIGIED